MAVLTESLALKIIRRELGFSFEPSSRGRVRLGIGDDCAILAPSKSSRVWTMDACNEGSHFVWEWMSPEDIAHKSFHAALSDIPAMGARATAALCQLTLSPRVDSYWLRKFLREQARLAKETKTPLIGGNICFGGSLQVVTTVIGSLSNEPLCRGGAVDGDEIWCVGELGLARAGLLLLQQKTLQKKAANREQMRCLEAFRRPLAQWRRGPQLVGRANSCMDLSDGLSRDLRVLAEASELRAMLDTRLVERLLPEELKSVAPQVGESALSLALEGGEDYALLATGPKKRRPRFANVIGRMEKGKGIYLSASGTRKAQRIGTEHP